jgi:hypothetical protein
MAAQFRMMAMGEPEGSEVRDKLLEVAAQYERIAEQAQAGRGAQYRPTAQLSACAQSSTAVSDPCPDSKTMLMRTRAEYRTSSKHSDFHGWSHTRICETGSSKGRRARTENKAGVTGI